MLHQSKILSKLKREPQMSQENHSKAKLRKPLPQLLLKMVSKLPRQLMLPREMLLMSKIPSMRKEELDQEELP